MCAILAPDPTHAEIDFTFGFPSGQIADSMAFSVNVAGAGPRAAIVKDDMLRINARYFRSDTLETAITGELTAECVVEEGDWQRSVAVDVALAVDTRISVSCTVADENPARTCWGCSGSRVVQLDANSRFGPADSLFLVWSRNSISAPVMF